MSEGKPHEVVSRASKTTKFKVVKVVWAMYQTRKRS